jgi:hypothetical protein
MHHSAYVNAEKFAKKYIPNLEGIKILDVGSYDVNGTMKPIFERAQYVGLDMEAGPNVDVVGVSHNIPFGKDEFDVVISFPLPDGFSSGGLTPKTALVGLTFIGNNRSEGVQK